MPRLLQESPLWLLIPAWFVFFAALSVAARYAVRRIRSEERRQGTEPDRRDFRLPHRIRRNDDLVGDQRRPGGRRCTVDLGPATRLGHQVDLRQGRGRGGGRKP